MNKKIVLISTAALITLASCDFSFSSLFGGKNKDAKNALNDLVSNGFALKEFGGYKIATEVKDGEKYLLGIYRHQQDLIRFVNGDYHADNAGTYEFYMATNAATVEGAAEVKVTYTTDTTFKLQVIAPGKAWDQKYIGIYAATSSYSNYVWSIAHLDSADQKQYAPSNATDSVKCYSDFQFIVSYNDTSCLSPAIYVADDRFDEEEATPKMFGTGYNDSQDYTSMDCSDNAKALDHGAYDLVHFYEKA